MIQKRTKVSDGVSSEEAPVSRPPLIGENEFSPKGVGQRSGSKALHRARAVCGGGEERISPDARSSWKERKGNALASGADEGRDKLRKAAVRSKYPVTRRSPNGATRLDNIQSACVEQNRRTRGTA